MHLVICAETEVIPDYANDWNELQFLYVTVPLLYHGRTLLLSSSSYDAVEAKSVKQYFGRYNMLA